MTVGSVLIFDVGGRRCALPASAVAEIVHRPELSRPPGLAPTLDGFLTLDGAHLPVLRLARLFGLGDTVPGLYTPLVVLRDGVALLVDRVWAVMRPQDDALLPVADDASFNGCARGALRHGEEVIALLDPSRILTVAERARVAAFAAVAAERLDACGGAEE